MKKQNPILVLCFAVAFFFLATNLLAKEDESRGGRELELVGQVKVESGNDAEDLDDIEVEVELEDLEDELDDDSDEDIDDDEDDDNKGRGEDHRSEIAEVVEKLLYIADRNGGIGEEIRKIAREQASSSDDVVEAVEKVEKRSKFKIFLIGTDYKNLGAIRSELVKMDARIAALGREVEKLIPFEQETIRAEIVALETERERLQKFIEENEDSFSLFGWVARLLTN